MVAGIKSERWPASNRNPRPDCVGIRTLAEWRRRFHANWADIAALGFDDRFRRLWDYYLCYCEAGFAEGTIDVSHYVIGPV